MSAFKKISVVAALIGALAMPVAAGAAGGWGGGQGGGGGKGGGGWGGGGQGGGQGGGGQGGGGQGGGGGGGGQGGGMDGGGQGGGGQGGGGWGGGGGGVRRRRQMGRRWPGRRRRLGWRPWPPRRLGRRPPWRLGRRRRLGRSAWRRALVAWTLVGLRRGPLLALASLPPDLDVGLRLTRDPYARSCCARPRRNSRQAASSAMSINSSGWCAWSMRPGPQTTAATPAR